MKKRILAMIMTLAMCLSLLPTAAFAAETWTDAQHTQYSNQIGKYYAYNASSQTFEADGSDDAVVKNNEENTKVTISKTIAPTGTENQFDVTLQVVAKEAIEETVQSPDLAVTLVMDISSSMETCLNCHKMNCSIQGHQTRIEKAKEAAETFVKTYAGFVNSQYTDPGAARYVSLVVFDGGAQKKVLNGEDGYWLDLHATPASGQTQQEATQAKLDVLFNQEDGIIATMGTGNGTNIDAGLYEAEDILKGAPANTTKFLVLLTDGQPFSHMTDAPGNGYTLPDGYPSNYYFSSNSYKYPAMRAMYIRNVLDTTFYSINLLAGDNVSTWLSSFSDKSVAANDGDQLKTAFEEILIRMKLGVDAWKVTDPMGEYIKYVSYEGTHGNGSVTVPSSGNNNTLTWDLRSDLFSTATTIVDGNGDTINKDSYQVGAAYTITYTLKYRIALDVAAMLADGKTAAADNSLDYVLTNKATKLDYYLTETTNGNTVFVDNDGEPITADGAEKLLTLYFKVPKVRGYAGDLSFAKVDEQNAPLAGATFTLIGTNGFEKSETSVAVEEGATTNNNVTISDIPSGATYTLKETDAPEGYQENSKEYTVEVNYGVATLKFGSDVITQIQNTLIPPPEPTTGTLIVTKTVAGLANGVSLPEGFKITVTGPNNYSEELTLSKADKDTSYQWTLDVDPGTYSVTESNYVVNGYSVKVTENASEVEVAAGKTETLALTNTYTAAPATLSSDKLNVSKVLSGRGWTEGDSFTFTLTGSNNAPMPKNDEVTIGATDESKTKSFGDITFTEAGTYTYTVKESSGSLSGVTYDNSVYTVTVVVSAEETGALVANATYQKGNESYTYGQGGMTFTNTYGASSVTVPSSDLQVSKVLSGREWAEDDSYTFTLTGSQGAPMPENTSVNITNANEKKSFGAITFTEAGTYTYTVQETAGELGGMSYDDSEYVITVTVTDNNQGQLLKSVSYSNQKKNISLYDSTAGMVFENTYSAQDATITGNTALKVSKTLTGRDWNDSDSYTFTLNTAGEGVETPMPAAGGETVTLTKSNQNGAFGNITFNKAGVYNYTVTENDDTTIAGVTKDDTTYHVTVTVTDNKAGQLEAAVTYMAGGTDYNDLYITNNGMKFTNTYSASGTLVGDTKLVVSKTLTGRDWAEGETFTFNIADVTEGAPLPANTSVTIGKPESGTVNTAAFGDIAYDEDDIGNTYTYTVKEQPGSATGVTYDATEYTVTVNVAVNADDASMLDVTAVYTSSADAEKETPAYNYATVGNMPFTNTYKAGSVIVPGDDGEGVEGKLEISKSFSGRDWAEGDVFTFNIAAVTEGAPMPASTSVTIGKPASGTENTGAFGNITFDEVGEYKYTVSETKGTLSNVTYDTVAYTVTINVTDDGTGALKYAVTYSSSKGEFDYTAKDGMAFVNTYSKPNTPSGPSTPNIPDNPPALNKVDHFAYIIGYPDGNVEPQGNITRAEVATIFFRMLTDESRAEFWSQSNDYSDVTATKWFNNAVSTLSNGGIITGYNNGTFKPNGNITRAEFATMAVRFFSASYEGEDLFPDIDKHWAKAYINTAAYEGIINGYEDGTFRPDQYITRAEAMTIVNRVLDRHPDKDNLLEDMIQWPDNMDTEKWYYADVQEATNSHDYDMEGTEAEPYEVWTEILPVRDWVALEKEWSDSNSAPGGEVMN